jgi:hypothetical protein
MLDFELAPHAGRARHGATYSGTVFFGGTSASRDYEVHGVQVALFADDPEVLGELDTIFRLLGLLPRASGSTEKGDVITLRFSYRKHSWQISGANMAGEQDGILAYADPKYTYLCCEGHTARLEASMGTGDVVMPFPSTRLRKDFIVYALLLLLRRRGLYGLHASGVSQGGNGLLFVGGCRSGKSTQTYNLVRQGWGYLGDDSLLLHVRGEIVEAVALRRDLMLNPVPFEAYPELAGRERARTVCRTVKWCVPMCEMYPAQLIARCIPRVLVFPEIVTSARSRLVPLGQAAALVQLVSQSVVFTLDREAIPGHLQVLGSLTRQAQSYRLLAGQDLKEHPEIISAILNPIRDSSLPPFQTGS